MQSLHDAIMEAILNGGMLSDEDAGTASSARTGATPTTRNSASIS
jgi:hypothetical protein